VGCPIRRSRDHRALAPPPSFSQRATSFIASRCQGIHQMPFSCSPTPSPKAALRAARGQRSRTEIRPTGLSGLAFRPLEPCVSSPLPGRRAPAYLHTHARARPSDRQKPESSRGLSCHARFTVTTRFTMSKRLAATPPFFLGGARRSLASIRAAAGGRLRPPGSHPRLLVGLGRFERPTSRLSGVRSNQLSYRPGFRGRRSGLRDQTPPAAESDL
jgi:hypothetical protein